MKFQKLDKINLRNETIQYLSEYVGFNNYKLYYGIINNYNGICVTTNDIDGEYFFKDLKKITFNNQVIKEDQISNLNEISDKYFELFTKNSYCRFPVTNDFIDWLKADIEIFTETKEDYNKISLPYINSIIDKNTKWMNDLLFNKSEEDLVLYRNSNFVIVKDIIWKNPDNSDFYILAIPTLHIKTIRDLNQSHILMLKEIKNKCIMIASKYGIPETKLYFYFHYHPSYYQLHLHVCIVGHNLIETKIYRHYLLDDIIEKLELDTNYWANSTLKFELMSCSKLFKLLKEK